MILRPAVAAFVVVAFAVSGCGSDTKTAASSESSTSSAASSSAASSSAPPSTQAADPNTTLTDYFASAGITATPVTRAEQGAPVVDFPLPAGWADAGPATPPDVYLLVTSTDPAPEPATGTFLLTRLTGGDISGNDLNAKIFEYAPNDQRSLPEFVDMSSSDKGTLSGFPSMDFGGTYVKDGVTHLVGQKTVVFPAKDGNGTYLLRIVVDATEEQFSPIATLTTDIDEKTTITP